MSTRPTFATVGVPGPSIGVGFTTPEGKACLEYICSTNRFGSLLAYPTRSALSRPAKLTYGDLLWQACSEFLYTIDPSEQAAIEAQLKAGTVTFLFDENGELLQPQPYVTPEHKATEPNHGSISVCLR